MPSSETSHVQEAHIAVGQLIAFLVEDELYPRPQRARPGADPAAPWCLRPCHAAEGDVRLPDGPGHRGRGARKEYRRLRGRRTVAVDGRISLSRRVACSGSWDRTAPARPPRSVASSGSSGPPGPPPPAGAGTGGAAPGDRTCGLDRREPDDVPTLRGGATSSCSGGSRASAAPASPEPWRRSVSRSGLTTRSRRTRSG